LIALRRALAPLALAALTSCRGTTPARAEARAELLVVAPHPDDEVLMAGALVAEARAR